MLLLKFKKEKNMYKENEKPEWWIYQNTGKSHDEIKEKLPDSPPWRKFTEEARQKRGHKFKPDYHEIEMVNLALYLRRPLLITGKPGVGKTSLAYAVAYELKLGNVLRWSITTRSKLQDGLYRYDAVARLQDTSLQSENNNNTTPDICEYLRLGPLGTAFAASTKGQPRVLLIDEIDKSDIDLPNDLLHIFEEGEFEIPELVRLREEEHAILPDKDDKDRKAIPIKHGQVSCKEFPLVIMTSNGEREFPPAFLRRCLQLEMKLPDRDKLEKIVKSHLKDLIDDGLVIDNKVNEICAKFIDRRDNKKHELATDQLLNMVYLVLKDIDPLNRDKEDLLNAIWKSLSDDNYQ
jgi:MoxR-like ATPase